jgi:hypothetical protein
MKYLIAKRWPHGVRCPQCVNAKMTVTTTWILLCRNCGTNYLAVSAGTVFHNTKCPLRTWFKVIWLMTCGSQSVLQIYREVGAGSYNTVWRMCRRIQGAINGTVASTCNGWASLETKAMPKPRAIALAPMTFDEVIAILVNESVESCKERKALRHNSKTRAPSEGRLTKSRRRTAFGL